MKRTFERLDICDGSPAKFRDVRGRIVDAFRYDVEGDPKELPLWFISLCRWEVVDDKLVVACLSGKVQVIVGDGDWILMQPSGEFAVLEDRSFWLEFTREPKQ